MNESTIAYYGVTTLNALSLGIINRSELKDNQNIDSIKEFIEKLSELEHDQWLHYSKTISQQIMEARSLEYLKKYVNKEWTPNWKSYDLLPEKEKEKDRIWANKVFDAIRSNPDVMKSILSKSARIH